MLERLVVYMDENQHIYLVHLGKDLVDPNGLNLLEPLFGNDIIMTLS